MSPGVGSLVGQPQITNGPPSYIYGAPMVVLQRWANRGSADTPTVGQQRTYRWCTVGPTVGQRWVNRGLPVASHRWPNSALIVGVPVGHRWPNGGPTEAHRWLATGGPTEARWTRPQWATGGCHRWPISTRTVGPPLAHQSNAIWDVAQRYKADNNDKAFLRDPYTLP